MGVKKEYQPTVSGAAQALTATGDISAYPKVTVCTVTSTGVVLTLPAPQAGLEKRLAIDYVGATGVLTVAANSTSVLLNGSTANVIQVSSSEEHLGISLVGMSASAWSVMTSTGSGVTFAASTVS
jgi:hypothetical protein